MRRLRLTAVGLPIALSCIAAALVAVPAGAQTAAGSAGVVATGAGRTDELSEAERIDRYLADADATPSTRTQRQVTAGELAASAGAMPPMAPDSPWARGVSRPLDGPLPLARGDGPPQPCDHRVHGEVGAEVGTGGGGGYGVATMPVGKDCWGEVTVGVSSFRGRGYGGYGGYGYGGRAYGRSGAQSAFSLGFSAGGRDAAEPRPTAEPEF